jgi:hypothetical protein
VDALTGKPVRTFNFFIPALEFDSNHKGISIEYGRDRIVVERHNNRIRYTGRMRNGCALIGAAIGEYESIPKKRPEERAREGS